MTDAEGPPSLDGPARSRITATLDATVPAIERTPRPLAALAPRITETSFLELWQSITSRVTAANARQLTDCGKEAGARQRHDGGRRSRHVSDPQPGAGGCRLEAAHSVLPEIRTCDRRPRQANAVLQTVPDKFGLPLGFAARTTSRHRVITTSSAPASRRQQAARAPGAGRPGATDDTGRRPGAGPSPRAGVRWRKRHKR
jgi:hypothetical protein